MKFNHNWLIAAGCGVLLAACSDPQQDWEAARLADTPQAYSEFLKAHPQGSYAQRARTRIEELDREQAWEDAQRTATASAYEAFLDQYPAGAHSREARQQVEDIEREAAWDRLRAQDEPTLEGLRGFVAEYPQSAEADQALTMIATLEAGTTPAAAEEATAATAPAEEPTPEPAAPGAAPAGDSAAPAAGADEGDVRVQLGAFRDQGTAEAERERIEQAYGDALGEVVVEPAGTEPPFFRIRSAPMARERARDACATLADDDQACIVVAR